MIGLPNIGSSGLGTKSVNGRSLVPNPAPSTNAVRMRGAMNGLQSREGGRGVQAWRGAALGRSWETRDICLGACMTANLFKQAAPGNVSTRAKFVCSYDEWIIYVRNDGQNITCGSSRGPL